MYFLYKSDMISDNSHAIVIQGFYMYGIKFMK